MKTPRTFFVLPIFAFFLHAVPGEAAPTISTVAGTGEKGYSGDGGKAVEAKLDNPFGVIVAPDGDIVFCDTINHRIRRISRKAGTIETLVGSGEKGYDGDGGDPKAAKMNEPYEVRFHRSGDLYWVEMQNNVVRKLDARSNLVSTVAGTGKKGFGGDGGPATAAEMDRPHSIQFDAAGAHLYICDIGNHRIRQVDLATGLITTWCGTGKAAPTPDGAPVSAETPLNGPRALDIAPNGDFWLALREGNQVFRIDQQNGTLHHVAGTGKKGFQAEPGPAKEALLSGPKGVAVSPDGKMIYLADTESHSVRAIDLNETPPVLRVIAGDGQKGDGPGSPDPLKCRMARLHGVGVDPITGDLYIGDSETHQVRRVTGLPGSGAAKLGDFSSEEFLLGERKCRLTKPAKEAPGKPWIWRCRFYGAFPAVDEALLAAGWHVAWIDVADLFGAPAAMDAFDAFYAMMTGEKGLSKTPVIEGFSRGGLPAMNWPIENPDKVAGVYLDAPVLDIHSWPKPASPDLWKKCLAAYSLTEESAATWQGPLARLEGLAKAGVPIFVVAGGADTVVPFADNAGILESRYSGFGGQLDIIVKAGTGHHPHSLHDPAPVVEWAKRVVSK
jgi:DNA-binding beta-propeller fold protein YncE/pimeloyl-ACP methyl ester carboxylesterase